MKDAYIGQEWKNFLNAYTLGKPDDLKTMTIPCSQAEYMLMQAFYAGFGACFGVVNNIVDDNSPEAEQCEKMDRIMDELQAFSAWQRDIGKKNGVPTERVMIRAGKAET